VEQDALREKLIDIDKRVVGDPRREPDRSRDTRRSQKKQGNHKNEFTKSLLQCSMHPSNFSEFGEAEEYFIRWGFTSAADAISVGSSAQ